MTRGYISIRMVLLAAGLVVALSVAISYGDSNWGAVRSARTGEPAK